MATLRRISVPLVFFVTLGVLGVSARQAPPVGQAQGQGASAQAGQPPAPAPAPVPRPPTPEQAALTTAVAIKDAEAKLAALEKIRTDFPQATNLAAVDQQLLLTLTANFPDRIDAISTVFERVIARFPAGAAPETRLTSTLGPVGVLVGKKLLLDRSEKLVTDAVGAMDFEKYVIAQGELATRSNRAAPAKATLETNFNSTRSNGLSMLARIYAAKDDTARAEDFYRQAVKASPAFGTAATALVDLLTAKNDYAGAEAVLKDSIKAATTPVAASRPMTALADLYIKKGDDRSAEATLRDVVKENPTLAPALISLARLEDKRGDAAAAVDHFMTASLSGTLKSADDSAMRTLYRKLHNGSEAGLDDAIDKAYRDKFPNPVKADPYVPTDKRSNRQVLVELFTGSGCPPCVASDLAFDAAMERYKRDDVIALAYHENIPAPDPMVAGNNNDRRAYYSVTGVPTFEIDGAMIFNPVTGGNRGGGGRTDASKLFDVYKAKIDSALERPATAGISVKATGEGDQISVTATVSNLPATAKDVRLHIVLAERELKFIGENGIRFHPMVVRATAGEKGTGIPITANGKTTFTFNLATIKDEITKTLAAEMVKRHSTEAAGSTPREYVAESRGPYTAIDTSELVVVAFLQEGAYTAPPKPATPLPAGVTPDMANSTASEPPPAGAPAGAGANAQATPAKAPDAPRENILQAAKADVVFATPPKGKGGGR